MLTYRSYCFPLTGLDKFFGEGNPFDCLDENKSGTLDFDETKNILTGMGNKIKPDGLFDELLRQCDMPVGSPIDYKKLYASMKDTVMK